MKILKFRLNHTGSFFPANILAPLGHPIYQVYGIPDKVSATAVQILLDQTCLTGHPGKVIFNFDNLGFGRLCEGEARAV